MTVYEGTLTRDQILAGFIEASRLGLRLSGRTFAVDADELNGYMEFEHVIYSNGRGAIAHVEGLWAPTAHMYEDGEGDWTTEFEAGQNRWQLMTGYSGQHGYNGPWMHQSEFIGGGMARDILATPGFYVAIYPSATDINNDPAEPDTWAVAYISENIPGSA